MLFTIQAYLEDYLSNRRLQDTDGYAVSLANLYFHQRRTSSNESLLRRMRKINTVLFENNNIPSRSNFEKNLLIRLDNKFKKKLSLLNLKGFPGGVRDEKKKWHKLKKRTIQTL